MGIVRGCRDHGVKLGVGYQLRQHPALKEARRLVGEGVLGPVALAQGQWGFGVRGRGAPIAPGTRSALGQVWPP